MTDSREGRSLHAGLGPFKTIFIDSFRSFRKNGAVDDEYIAPNGESHIMTRADQDHVEHTIISPDGKKSQGYGTRHH